MRGVSLAVSLFVVALVVPSLSPHLAAQASGTGIDPPLVKHLMPLLGTVPGAPTGPSAPTAVNLVYGGGAVQTVPHVYLVFWGFGTPAVDDPNGEAAYLTNFFRGVGGSGWANIQTEYWQTGPTYITNPVAQFTPATDVWYDTAVTDLPGILPDALLAQEAVRASAHFGYSANADYIIATPHGRNTAGFGVPTPVGLPLVGYCAWHSATNGPGGAIAFTNLPYQTDAPLGVCGANFVNGGAAGLLDGVSIVAGHEYAEAVTDPEPTSGWADANGQENGDKCAWLTAGPGRTQNVVLTSGTFAVQGMWSNAASGCVITSGYLAKANGPYATEVGHAVAIAASSSGGTGASSCAWSGAGATFGAATSCSTTVSFASSGAKGVTVAMTDSAAPAHTSSSTASVSVAAALVADAGGPYAGAVGASIAIAATHTGGVAGYTCAWSGAGATFGSASSCTTTVSYTSAGSKTASMTMTDGVGVTSTDTATVTVSAAALTAVPGGPYAGVAGVAKAIAGSGSGGTPGYTCAWSSAGATFGSAAACATTVTFAASGSYTLSLTVTDAAAGTATATTPITVTASCASDPAGDVWQPATDPVGLYDIVTICGHKTGTTLDVTFVTAGLAVDNILGAVADPVTYRVSVDSMPAEWESFRVAGQWVTIDANHGLPSAATVTATATGITVHIPLTETGAVTAYSGSTATAGYSHGYPVARDYAPNTGTLPV